MNKERGDYMFKVDGTTIHCTRGDAGNIKFTVNNGEYKFAKDDVITLKVYEKGNVDNVLLKKDVKITGESTSVIIELTTLDTKIGNVINKPAKYWYEISINDEHTVIGYDDEGTKEFILYPEGGEKL